MNASPALVTRLNDPDVVLGAHVNAMRHITRCTQAALGNVIGVSQTVMSKKLRGEVSISFAELLLLADYFQVSVSDMIPTQYRRGEGAVITDR